jgi:hypothetical protein
VGRFGCLRQCREQEPQIQAEALSMEEALPMVARVRAAPRDREHGPAHAPADLAVAVQTATARLCVFPAEIRRTRRLKALVARPDRAPGSVSDPAPRVAQEMAAVTARG